MPIYVTDGAGVATLQAQVTLGSKNISKVYWGSTLKFQGTLTYDLLSDTNVNLETFILSKTAVTSSAIVINIPSGNIIGSTAQGTPAMVTGDLSAYTRGVTLNVIGEIQGAGGTLTLDAGDAFTATSDLTINNAGAIRAGGGGGGNGGLGGYGEDATWYVSFQATVVDGRHTYGWRWSSDRQVWWADTRWAITTSNVSDKYWKTGSPSSGNIWERGNQEDGLWYYTRYGKYTVGSKGTGGAGGIGQGYTQTKVNGIPGGSGTHRAGSGGDGGNGGNWGEVGVDGNTGGSGLYISGSNYSQSAAGASGAAGTLAGNAIDSGSATVTLLGAGVVNGDVI